MNSSRKRKGEGSYTCERVARHFEVTIPRSELNRKHIFYALEDVCSCLIVARENHADDQGRHFHIYVCLKEARSPEGFTEFIASLIYDEDDDVKFPHTSTLQRPDNWIRYCTKEDRKFLHKCVDYTKFHIAYRIYYYVSHNRVFSCNHPFVAQHYNCSRFIREAHSDYWASKDLAVFDSRLLDVIPDTTVEWVSRFFEAVNRKANIYLYGASGIGKTVCCEFAVRNSRRVYLDCKLDHFEFGKLTSDLDFVVAPDVGPDYVDFHRERLLRLCDKCPSSINPKCMPQTTILFTGQIVIVSNYAPNFDASGLRRFTVINAHDVIGFSIQSSGPSETI